MWRSLAAVVAGVVLLLGAQRSLAEPKTQLAILPIVVHTLEHKEYLQAGLADMLASRLGRVPGIAVVRVQGEGQATSDLEAARSLGREAGARYVMFGSFTQFGEGASLDLQCAAVEVDGEAGARSIFVQSGTLGEIIPQLDRVAEKVGRHITSSTVLPDATSEDLPAVGAGAPSDSDLVPGELLQDALSELEALRGRVDALEERVFLPPVESFPESEPGSALDVFETDPELHSDLR